MPQLSRPTGPRRPPLAAARRGITLVEVMITISVLAIVGASLTSILTRQQRFYRDASETVEVRRELRGGSALLPTDLRAISTAGGDLLEATATQFTIRATIGSAVVCAKDVQSVDLVPTGLTTHTLAAWYSLPRGNDTAFVFDDSLNVGAVDDYWWQAAVVSTIADATYCAGTPFVALVDAALPRVRLTLDTPVPATVQIGAVVRITRPVRYTVFQPSAGSDWYLGYSEYDGAAWQPVEPIAGPLTATSGARFTYFDTTGTVRTPTTAAERTNVARVGVTMRATGRTDALQARSGQPMRDSLEFKIGIRNFR